MDGHDTATAGMRQELAKAMRDSYRGRYDDLVQMWRATDTKAQGTAAIGGVLIAALFAFVRDASASGFEDVVLCLLIAAAVLTALSVGASLLALRMRRVPAPPLGKATEELVSDILACPDEEIAQRMDQYYRDDAVLWRKVDDTVSDASRRKARWVWVSQLFLFAALALMALIAVGILYASVKEIS